MPNDDLNRAGRPEPRWPELVDVERERRMPLVTLAGMIAVIFGAWLVATRPSQYRYSLGIGILLLVVGIGLSLLAYGPELGLLVPTLLPMARRLP